MLARRRVRLLAFSLLFIAGYGLCRAQSPPVSSSAYDLQPILVGTGVVGQAHCQIVQFDPKDASKTKDIIVAAMVGRQGLPMSVHVVHGAGMGFDEKAIMAVRQLRFHAAEKDGAPVASSAPVYIRVTFEHLPAPPQ